MTARWTMRAPLTARWRLALLAAAVTLFAGVAVGYGAYGRTIGAGSTADEATGQGAPFAPSSATSRDEALGAALASVFPAVAPEPAGNAAPGGFAVDGGFAPSSPGVNALDLLGRQIIRNGSIDMEVESVAAPSSG